MEKKKSHFVNCDRDFGSGEKKFLYIKITLFFTG